MIYFHIYYFTYRVQIYFAFVSVICTYRAKLAIAIAICDHICHIRTLLIHAHNVKAEFVLITAKFIIKLTTIAPTITYN